MLGFTIADLFIEEKEFSVTAHLGTWQLNKVEAYEEIVRTKKPGQCATTFVISNENLDTKLSDTDFEISIDEVLDVCLVLSFLTGKCVTVMVTGFVKSDPTQDGAAPDAGFFRKWDLPLAAALLLDQTLLFARLQISAVYQLANDAKTKRCYLLFVSFGHHDPPWLKFRTALRQKTRRVDDSLR